MEQPKDLNKMLDLMIQPAFSVIDGTVSHINAAAESLLLERGTPLDKLLITGQQEYAALTEGSLYLTVRIGGQVCGASVRRLGEAAVVTLEQEADQAELQAMALAARELRQPLSNVMTVADRLFPVSCTEEDPELQNQVARINRGLYQMLRIISNMSDAYRYTKDNRNGQQTRDVCALLSEIFESHRAHLESLEIELSFTVPQHTIYCLIDEEKLERAVSNILSNAVKFSRAGSQIRAALVRKGDLLYLTVEDGGCGIAEKLKGTVHSRYLREPGVEDGRYGIGLGMVLIRSAATAHGGTVLIQQPAEAGTRITLTLQIRQNRDAQVRSPLYSIDYAGERDHRLLELSESLPLEAFYNQNNS